MKSLFCSVCGKPLRAGIDYSCPSGDDSCMEGRCPYCTRYFTLCLDGCVVRDAKASLVMENMRLQKALDTSSSNPRGTPAFVVFLNARELSGALVLVSQAMEGVDEDSTLGDVHRRLQEADERGVRP